MLPGGRRCHEVLSVDQLVTEAILRKSS
jgi:hypothetical protein